VPKGDKTNSSEPPQLMGVTSTSNNTVLILFNKPMGGSAEDVSLYKILRSQGCDQDEWQAQLSITKAELGDDNRSVTLTTMAQTGVTYQLSVTGVSDQAGNHFSSREDGGPWSFVGVSPSDVVDTDSDGLSDSDEQYGWTVSIELSDSTEVCKYVTSDPDNDDTDSDGVKDNVEMANATNPRSKDTDGDDLTDIEEMEYFSNPTHQDTDLDGITDGMEAKVYKTSPALSDTDGDGANDYEEIITGGRNPRLADLPKLDLELYGDPIIVLNITEGTVESQISSSLEQDRSEYQSTDTVSTLMSLENTVRLHTEVSVGTSHWPPSANATLTTDTEFKHAYVNETSSSWTRNSVEDVMETFESETTATTTFHNGIVAVSMKLVNNSDLSFKLKSPRVMAYRMTPGGSFSVVGALEPGKLEIEDETQHWMPEPDDNGYVIGPGGSLLLLFGTGDLPSQIMKPLMQNPTALMFEIGSYTLFQLDEFGVEETKSYDKVGEDVLARTGLIVIDYGDGRVERYPVATNLRRNPDGSGSGVTMKEALSEIINLDYQTIKTTETVTTTEMVTTTVNPTVLYKVGNEKIDSNGDGKEDRDRFKAYHAEDEQAYGYWLVGGTQEIFKKGDLPESNQGVIMDFNEIMINSGDRVSLVWIEDQDGDGLTDREEYLVGTDMQIADSDEDGLSDYDEAREGWMVEVKGQSAYAVLSDPRFADSDGDGLNDGYERDASTDPFLIDTDHDDLKDNVDPLPISGQCVQNMTELGLVAWWRPSLETEPGEHFADDIWEADKKSQRGDLIGYDPTEKMIIEQNGEQFFSLNRGLVDDQYIEVEDDEALSPKTEFTIAAWIIWDGTVASNVDRAVLITKGPNYSLFLQKDGSLLFAFTRYVWETANWRCPDKHRDSTDYVTTDENVIKPDELYHVVVTFGKKSEYLRIYINSDLQRKYDVRNKHGYCDWTRHTEYIYTNTEFLAIGNTLDSSLPFKGMVKEIQFFGKEMKSDDVNKLYTYGLCEPNP